MATYIENWFVSAPTCHDVAHHTDAPVQHLDNLGFQIDLEKGMMVALIPPTLSTVRNEGLSTILTASR